MRRYLQINILSKLFLRETALILIHFNLYKSNLIYLHCKNRRRGWGYVLRNSSYQENI